MKSSVLILLTAVGLIGMFATIASKQAHPGTPASTREQQRVEAAKGLRRRYIAKAQDEPEASR